MRLAIQKTIFESKKEKRKNRKSESKRITLGSSGFLSRSWFKTSTHSANFPDWKCKAASLASAAATERTASSSAAEGPSRFAAADDDEDESRASIRGSTKISRNSRSEKRRPYPNGKPKIQSEKRKFTSNRKP